METTDPESGSAAEHPFVQKGYDAWIELWVRWGHWPSARDCAASRLEEDSDERRAYIQGWNKARREAGEIK